MPDSPVCHILASPGYAPGTIAVMLHGSKENSMLVKRLQHVPIYLQRSIRNFKSSPFQHIFCTFWPPWVRPWDNRGKYYMDQKRIQCLSKTSQHVPINLQPFPSNSSRNFKSSPFQHFVCTFWPPLGTPPETIAVNVTWIKREFNACQTPRSMHPSIFNHL